MTKLMKFIDPLDADISQKQAPPWAKENSKSQLSRYLASAYIK